MTAVALRMGQARDSWISEISAMAPRLAGTLGTSGASAALGIVTGTIAARVLGPATRGELAQLLLWPQMIVTVGSLGIELSAVYFSGGKRRADVPATLLGVALLQAVLLICAYVALIPIVYRDPALMRESLVMLPLIPLYLLGAVAIDCLAGRLRFAAFNAVRITLPATYCAAIVTLALTGHLSPLTGAAAYVAAHCCADALALVLLWRERGFGSFSPPLAREALRYGAKAHFGRMTPQSLGIDTAIIALLLASDDVGLYVAATAFLAAPGLVASSVGMVVFPQVSVAHQAGGRLRLGSTFALYAAAVLGIATTLFVTAPFVVTLFFGDAFAASAPALRWLCVASVALALRSFPIEVLRGIGRPGLTSLAELVNWVLFLMIVPAAAHTAGLTGTAAGVAVASGASLFVLAAMVWRAGVLRTQDNNHMLSASLEAAGGAM